MRLGLLFTLRHPELGRPGEPSDAWDDADTPDTHAAIADTLRALGHSVPVRLDTAVAAPGAYAALRGCDLALCLAAGWRGRDRTAQAPAWLESLGVPYLGSPPLAQALCLDKAAAKRLLRAAGLPTPAFAIDRRPRGAPYPLFVKPSREGSSKGVTAASRVRDARELAAAAARVRALYGQPALVEPYLPGREFCTALLGDRVLPVLEVGLPPRGFAVAADKEDLWANLPVACPASVPAAVVRELVDVTRRACRLLGVRHMARLDFRWDGRTGPQLIDINPLPTLRRGGSFYEVAARAAGLDYAGMWAALLAAAIAAP